ncbi:lysine 2,3-aminomutase [Deinococcus metallilatus]|uniref:L-lysine 2,3-aminomutase n=1 Tax=Deinococcus metallilatus TaxID=1211322 RepID=A0AAJ5F4G5_9DEIO|nr:lysine 2,3-aminomutase [Deinococcus metallilatus]MBB5295135.1 lysine 2,3-aminomutase [Deinococcus metallilatus]QBY08687.1 lysine 2,3-aminomutase [Deinococcus metallilatus]RXJ10566.1 lysine 2,3-aminomutase [Deinococcus metallilatus]TLK26537.1 lysine 2,3-aminomutase [Deinococcus metallilatus]GMA14908.1 lysine 2,3-aminomutase [Deinococcus metallilatus]
MPTPTKLHPEATVRSQQMLPRNHRAPKWQDVPDEQWYDWKWQLKNRINSVEELEEVIRLTPSERAGASAEGIFRLDITPYFASLMDPEDPTCPVRRQVIPTHHELEPFTSMMEDSLAEDKHSPVPGLVHRYPDRVLMLVTTQCASYCRYCTRSRIVGDPSETFKPAEYEAQLNYLRNTPQVRDVLLSGGDPLTLAPKVLAGLLSELRKIEHIEIIRIGTRVPVFMPMRVTQELCDVLAAHHPLWMNIHVNHPKEITPEVADACDRLTRAGVPLGNQSVLLRGVNDHPVIMQKLLRELVKIRVRPYYIYQCDLVHGAGHLRTTVAKGLEIMESLRGHTSGYSVPTYVVDAPGGGGKIPVAPNYVLSHSPEKLILRNFEGYIAAYSEPTDYTGPDMAVPEEWQRREPGQSGIYGLMEGERISIEPREFSESRNRPGATQHRLNSREDKWAAYGVGENSGPLTHETTVTATAPDGQVNEPQAVSGD